MIVLILFVIVFSYFFFHLYWKRRNLPPGPMPIPFFGNLLSFYFTDIDIQLQKWKNQYGDLHTIWYGDRPVLSLHDAPTIFETFVKDSETYAGRGQMKMQDLIKDGRNGIVFVDGPKWRENRRFALHVFRNFGLGRNLMQERVLVEVTSLISDIKDELRQGKKDVSFQDAIDLGVGGIINGLTLGYRYGKEKEKEFQKVKKFAQFLIDESGNPINRIMEGNPNFYKKFPIFSSYYKFYMGEKQKIRDFFQDQINNHRKAMNFDDNDLEPNDFVEAYLLHQHKLNKDGIKDHHFDDSQLYGTILDLWVAGQETTSTALAWFCVFFVQYPEVQKKIHDELDEFIGSDRIITLDDKSNLNYVNAVVAEAQRYGNIAILNAFHRTTKDTVIHGYKIPENTLITEQVSTVLMDERYFPEPNKFKPERFLDKNGKFFQPPELMVFGVGKRACLGESLARLELFLFASNISNQFKLDYPTNKENFGKKVFSGTLMPSPFLCKAESRF